MITEKIILIINTLKFKKNSASRDISGFITWIPPRVHLHKKKNEISYLIYAFSNIKHPAQLDFKRRYCLLVLVVSPTHTYTLLTPPETAKTLTFGSVSNACIACWCLLHEHARYTYKHVPCKRGYQQ